MGSTTLADEDFLESPDFCARLTGTLRRNNPWQRCPINTTELTLFASHPRNNHSMDLL